MKNLFSIFLLLLLMASAEAGENTQYARAEIPTPVLNTPDFRSVFGGADGQTLNRDRSGLIRAVEFIAFPGTVFEIEDAHKINGALIYRVRTAEYPPQKNGLYIDSRFVSVSARPISPRKTRLPSRKQILDQMTANEGARYIWGGNISSGIPELLQAYPPSTNLPPAERDVWMLKGLDCSGLLYEATNGMTPRNTSDLISFGKPVTIAGLGPAQIAGKLRPLDLIVWKGHVIFVLDQTHTIESCMGCSPQGGVTIRKLDQALEEVMRSRTPVNRYPSKTSMVEKPFVIRRWI